MNESLVLVRYRIQDAWGWCTGMTQRDDMRRKLGAGFRIGNSCTPGGGFMSVYGKTSKYSIVK